MSHFVNLQESYSSESSTNFPKHKASSKSIAHQLPMSYHDYQEMKSNITHDSGKKIDYYSNIPSTAQILRNPKSSLRAGETAQTLETHTDNTSRDTPFFITHPSVKDTENLSFDEKGSMRMENSHQRNEEQYRKLVQVSIEQISKLKGCKDQLIKQQDYLKSTEEEITQAAEQSMSELTRKYQEALKKVEDYFESCAWKVKELEAQKKEHLKGKFNENRFLISELISSINTMETKIQLQSPQAYLDTFEKEYAESEKLLEKASKGEPLFSKPWKSFPLPAFYVSIDEIQSQPVAMTDDFSIGMSLVRTEDIDPLSTTTRTFNFLSPQPKFENTQERSNFCSSPYIKDQIREVSAFYEGKLSDSKTRGASSGLRDANMNTYTERGGPYGFEKKTQGAIRIEDGNSVANKREYRSRGDENRMRDGQEGRREAKAKSISEAERAQKKVTYKDIIRKMKHEASEKDQILHEMIKSYKDLERKYSKAVKEAKMKKTEMISNPNIYDEVLRSVTNIVEKHRGEMKPKSETLVVSKRTSSLSKQKEAHVEPTEYFTEARDKQYRDSRNIDRPYEEQRTEEVQRRGNRSLPRGDDRERKYGSERAQSRERKYTSGIQMSTVLSDNIEAVSEGEMIDKIQIKDGKNMKRVRVYIPFGQPTYSNYYLVGVQEDNTVDEVLQLVLESLGLKDTRSYKYYLSFKNKEILPEKSLMSAERLWDYLEGETSKNLRWPRLYVRSYDNKFS